MQLEHFNISAPFELLERVRDFYVNALGLREGARPAVPVRGFWLYDGDQALVHLAENNTTVPAPPAHYLDHIAFACTDLPALEQRLRAHAVDYTVQRYPAVNLTQVFLHDPAGTGIELNFRS